MHYLSSIDRQSEADLERELRLFFRRLRHIKHQLTEQKTSPKLNRFQRYRCKQNLFHLQKIERDFDAISYPDDVRHLYRIVLRYVKLDTQCLTDVFGRERVERGSLFVAL